MKSSSSSTTTNGSGAAGGVRGSVAAAGTLRAECSDSASIDALAATHPRIGLEGVLSGAVGRGLRAHWGRVPAAAATAGFRWRRRDNRSRIWWPQGIDIHPQRFGDATLLAVSWYAKPHRDRRRLGRADDGGGGVGGGMDGGVDGGSRVTFVALRPGRAPRYWHVALVKPVVDAVTGDVRMRPVLVHAGGLAWSGDQLAVAATFGGVRLFDVRNILLTRSRRLSGLLPTRATGPFGVSAVLPQTERWVPQWATGERARFSFLARDYDGGQSGGNFVAGEYVHDAPGGRLVRVSGAGGSGLVERHIHLHPGMQRMQGAALVDGTWFVATSEGSGRNGDLWVGEPGDMKRHVGVLGPGPEDLAFDPERRMLWNLSEHPGHRWVYSISLPSREPSLPSTE